MVNEKTKIMRNYERVRKRILITLNNNIFWKFKYIAWSKLFRHLSHSRNHFPIKIVKYSRFIL